MPSVQFWTTRLPNLIIIRFANESIDSATKQDVFKVKQVFIDLTTTRFGLKRNWRHKNVVRIMKVGSIYY